MALLERSPSVSKPDPRGPLIATVAAWHETPSGGFSLAAASYGIAIIAPSGVTVSLWGAGYAPNPPPMFILAVHRLLQVVPPETHLTVHAHKELEKYLRFPDGHVRYAMDHNGRGKSGSVLPCYAEMREIALALDANRWNLKPYSDGWSAPHFPHANGLARGVACDAAKQHKAATAPTTTNYASPAIVQEGP